MPRKIILVQITAPHFVAGLEFNGDTYICKKAAPIIQWMKGQPYLDIQVYCERKAWNFAVVKQEDSQ